MTHLIDNNSYDNIILGEVCKDDVEVLSELFIYTDFYVGATEYSRYCNFLQISSNGFLKCYKYKNGSDYGIRKELLNFTKNLHKKKCKGNQNIR